jgi:hypothetical protein
VEKLPILCLVKREDSDFSAHCYSQHNRAFGTDRAGRVCPALFFALWKEKKGNETRKKMSKLKKNETENTARSTHPCTYLDCLAGRADVPQDPVGKLLFTLLMTGGMVTFMVSVNALHHGGLADLRSSLWMFPLVACIAFTIRMFYGGPLADKLAEPLVLSRFTGVKRGIGMTVLNVTIMSPVMCALVTLLLHGTNGYLSVYPTTLLHIYPIALAINFFIVGPIVKMLYNNLLAPRGSGQAIERFRKYVMPLAYFFNS